MDPQDFTPLFDQKLEKFNDEIDVRELLESNLQYWKWYILSIIFAGVLTFAYLRYTSAKYEVYSTVLIDDKSVGGITTEMSAFQDLPLMGGSITAVVNEIGILQSRSLMEKVVRDLGLNISYFQKGEIKDAELYKNNVPFKINFFIDDAELEILSKSFIISPYSNNEYILKNSKGEIMIKGIYGKNVSVDFGELNITPLNPDKINMIEEILVKIRPVKDLTEQYRNRVVIEEQTVGSSLITLTLKDNIKIRAMNILDDLIYQYNKETIENKTFIAESTNKFINQRVDKISKDLLAVDLNVEEFKVQNSLMESNQGTSIILQSNSDLESRIVDLNSQIRLIDYVTEYMKSNPNDLIPANLGLKNDATGRNSNAYNMLIMERNRILKTSSNKNPTVVNLNSQIANLKQSIDQSLNTSRASLEFSLSELTNQKYRLNSKINSAPKQERQIRDVQRQQQITETLYLYLLQKREENALSIAGITPNAKVVDNGYGSDIPISPNRKIVYAVAILLSLLIPFGVISILFLVDNKVHNIEQLGNILHAPILGDIPRIKGKQKFMDFYHDKTSVAEAFRMLRTNLGFMFSDSIDKGKTIFITSTIGGEGKTMISINLASVLASNNKKVLLIGADLRKPKIIKRLKKKLNLGLTNYLVNMDLQVSDVIENDNEIGIDMILAGAIPPNPSELLTNGRLDEVFEYSKKNYDYIIVDTAPVSLVTDTLLIAKYADLFIYIVRANYLDIRLLRAAKNLYKNKRLPNMAMLLNDSDTTKNGYGYGYGYGN